MEATVISEGTIEQEEAVFPCKGCGEILEEGKAFELAGNRWHIDCFRCNNCRTLLDSDANLLLLGDGSLICNNCTYSCTVCKNKIEDLAILTGEQAFCAKCFKCRNCKRKIENLKYAKTSQGIFCMQCHESLMARRRKKTRQTGTRTSSNQSHQSGSNSTTLDKTLPALPSQILASDGALSSEPNSATGAAPTTDASQYLDSPGTLEGDKEHILLTPRTFGDSNHTTGAYGAEEMEVPLTLDPSPGLPSRDRPTRDYFGIPKPPQSNFRNDFADILGSTSARSGSPQETSQSKSKTAPYSAYQEKVRSGSSDYGDATIRRKEPGSSTAAPRSSDADVSAAGERRSDPAGRRSSGQHALSSRSGSPVGHIMAQTKVTPPSGGSPSEYSPRTVPDRNISPEPNVPKRKTSFKRSPLASPNVGLAPQFERPARGDSMRQNGSPGMGSLQVPADQANVGKQETGKKSATKPVPSHLAVGSPDSVPARSPRRPFSSQAPPNRASQEQAEEDIFTAPRDPPPVPADARHRQHESITSIGSEYFESKPPSSPYYIPNTGQSEHFNDAPRDDEDTEMPGILRKMSKAVRHGRSHSDKIGNASPKWTSRGSRNTSVDIKTSEISNPMATTFGEGDSVDLRNKLRYSQQRIAELEAEKMTLQEKFNGIEDIRQVNSELRQKRSTVAMLDTQRETVIRELEIMTEQLQKAKNTNQLFDVDKLRSDVMREFAQSMTTLKETLFKDIEQLMARKNELTNEISSLIQMKDKGFQEYESLSSKNQQLAAHNSQLVQSIQDLYRQGKQPNTPGHAGAPPTSANGLGIYGHHSKEPSSDLLEATSRQQYDNASQLSNEGDGETGTVMTAPKVVDLRKGQPKKFISWRKGRDAVKQNVTKGLKGAFGNDKSTLQEEGNFQEGFSYSSLQAGEAPTTGEKPLAPSRMGPGLATIDQGRSAWLRREAPGSKGSGSISGTTLRPSETSGSTTSTLVPASSLPPAETTLFGSDLTARCEVEKSMVPQLVLTCVHEVSTRGLDQEGIYRKSGSSTQVRSIQAGFESATPVSGSAYDISDPDLDIHAVTGCLKQYFRRLPNPLVTFECYDAFLDAVRVEGEEKGARVRRLKGVVEMLPKAHHDTLEFLCFHLTKVMERQAVNLMTPLNIAVVFAPTIMRPFAIEREITDTGFQRGAVQLLLENYGAIFEDR